MNATSPQSTISAASLRRAPVASPTGVVSYDAADIERLLPHRPPMRLVDAIDAFDPDPVSIAGRLWTRAEDPVFTGHFPGDPVYPGVLLVEAMGQLGLCGCALEASGGQLPPPGTPPQAVRIIKLHHAAFLSAVGPGQELRLLARMIENNGYTAMMAGQVWLGSELCATSISEVYFV